MGRKKKLENVVRSGLSVLFQSRFNGPRFTVGCNYFCKHGKQRLSLFVRHCQRLYTAWKNPFRSKGFTKEDYVSTFSSVSWDSLSEHEKSSHSISKCFSWAKMYGELQRSFPLSPIFEPDSSVINTSSEESFLENEYPKFNNLCEKMVGKPFAEVASNHPQKLVCQIFLQKLRKPFVILNVSVFLNVVIVLISLLCLLHTAQIPV